MGELGEREAGEEFYLLSSTGRLLNSATTLQPGHHCIDPTIAQLVSNLYKLLLLLEPSSRRRRRIRKNVVGNLYFGNFKSKFGVKFLGREISISLCGRGR